MAAPSPNNNAGFANVDIMLILLVPGMDFRPVPGKMYGIPLVSGAYPQEVLETITFRDVPRKGGAVSGRPPKEEAGGRAKP